MAKKTDVALAREVARRYRAGESVDAMAAEFQVTGRTVRNWLKAAGAKMRTLKQAWAVRKRREATK